MHVATRAGRRDDDAALDVPVGGAEGRALRGGAGPDQGVGSMMDGDGRMSAMDQTFDVREGVDEATVAAVASLGAYKYGFETDVEMEYAPKGVNSGIVRLISDKNGEPEWMTEWRLAAFERW